jgi:hypothetical protein
MIEGHLSPHKEKIPPRNNFSMVKEGLEFILDHFDSDVLFPRTIMTKKLGYQKIVFSKEEALQFFVDSDYIDCRINAFPLSNNSIPNFLFIDLDNYCNTEISIHRKLQATLSNTIKRLDGIPTVLWTGNGYHVYQPLECTVQFKDIEDFNGFENTETLFLRFGKNFLSDGYSDCFNNPSLKSCLLRVPNSFNSKCLARGLAAEQAMVRVVNKWNYVRPSIGNLMGSFYAFLVSERIILERRKIPLSHHNKRYSYYEIQWIEKLLETPLTDHRKYCLWRIFVPYLMNVKYLSTSDTLLILETWCYNSNKLRSLDFNAYRKIKENITHVNNYLPISKANLKKQNPDLFIKVNSSMSVKAS